jgi:hypothetical protein
MCIRTMREWSWLERSDQPDLEVFMVSSSSIGRNRDELVIQARNWGAEWILWLDTDQTFPSNTLLMLLSRNRPVIGANYPRRTETCRPTAAVAGPGGKPTALWTTKEKADARLIEPVLHMGLGCCLVSMAAIDGAGSPLFPEPAEDAAFFAALRKAGFEPAVDHFLSWHTGHIGTQVLTNADSVARRNGGGGIDVYPLLPDTGPE